MSTSDKPIDYVRVGALASIWQRRIGGPPHGQAPIPHEEPHHLPPRAKVHGLHGSEDSATDHKLTDPNAKITKPGTRASEARRSRPSAKNIQSLNDRVDLLEATRSSKIKNLAARVSAARRSAPSAEYIRSLSDRVDLLEATATSQFRPDAPEFKSRSQAYPNPEDLLAKLKAFQPGSQANHYLHTSSGNPTLPPSTSTQSKTLQQTRLKEVVDAALKRANALGNPIVALATKKFHEESLHNTDRARLLDAVLSGNTTAEEDSVFREFTSKAESELKLAKVVVKVLERVKAQEAAKDAGEVPTFVREVENDGMDSGAGESTVSETKVAGSGHGKDDGEWTLVEEKEASEPWVSVEKSGKEKKGATGLDRGR